MKNNFLAIATILLLTQGTYSQSEPKPKGDIVGLLVKSDEEQITSIDKITQEIKANLSSYTKSEKVKDNSGYSYVYTKQNELQLIVAFYKDKDVDKNVEWYFRYGRLIYSEQIRTDKATNKIVDNEKFYLDNEHLFAWFKSGKKVDVNSPEFKKTADELTAYADKLRADNLK